MSRIRAPDHEAAHGRRDVAATDDRRIQLTLMLSGARHVAQQGARRLCAAGDIFLLDPGRPFTLGASGGDYGALKLTFPRHLLGAAAFEPHFAQSAALKTHRLYDLLRSTCRTLAAGLRSAPDPEMAGVVGAASHLIAAIAQRTSLERVEARRDEAFRLIDLKIEDARGDPELSLPQVARALDVSPRFVQRVLAERDTTFTDLLREKRLQMAAALLGDRRRSVQAVAESCGYVELSGFHRAFKRRFGETPAAFRAVAG